MVFTRSMTIVTLLAVLLMAMAVPRVDAASTNLYVGTCHGPSPYTTIQSAVDAVSGGGFTIFVCPGTYNETVRVQAKDTLTIRNYAVANQPAPLIDAGNSAFSDGIDVIDSQHVTIQGLRITNASVGVYAFNAPSTEVRRMLITATNLGIFFVDGSNNSLAQHNIVMDGFAVGGSAYGLGTQFTVGVTIKQNRVTNVNGGIYALGADMMTVEANRLTNGSGVGINLNNVTHTILQKNTTNFYTTGVSLSSDSILNTITKNLLQGNGTDAIDLSSGSQSAGTANTWTDNTCDTSIPIGLCANPATNGVSRFLASPAATP